MENFFTKYKWWLLGGAAALGAYWYMSGGSSNASSTDSGLGQVSPDLTYAQAPISTEQLGTSGGDTGTAALNSLAQAVQGLAGNPSDTTQLASIQAGVTEDTSAKAVTVFQTLTNFMNAHKGLKNIHAIVPGIGDIAIGPQPTKVITKTVIKKIKEPTPTPTPKPTPKPAPHIITSAHTVVARANKRAGAVSRSRAPTVHKSPVEHAKRGRQ